MHKLLLLVVCLILCGCGGLHEAQVRSERATFDAVAPDLRKVYSGQALQLDAEQQRLRLLTVDSWQARIEGAERALAAQGGAR